MPAVSDEDQKQEAREDWHVAFLSSNLHTLDRVILYNAAAAFAALGRGAPGSAVGGR